MTQTNYGPNNNQLSAAVEEAIKLTSLNTAAMNFLQDLDVFLQYIDRNPEIKVSKVNQTIPLKVILAIEQQFRKLFKPTQSSKQIYHLEVHCFMAVCTELTILRVNDQNRLSVTTYGKKFRQLPQARQYALFFETFWWRVPWKNLMPKNSWLRNDRTQAEAACLAEILRNAPVQEKIRYDTFWEFQNRLEMQKLLNGIVNRVPIVEETIYSEGVWVQKIMPFLAYLGLLEVEVTFPTSSIEAAQEPVRINQFQITGWGQKIFEILCHIEEENELEEIEEEDDDLEEEEEKEL